MFVFRVLLGNVGARRAAPLWRAAADEILELQTFLDRRPDWTMGGTS